MGLAWPGPGGPSMDRSESVLVSCSMAELHNIACCALCRALSVTSLALRGADSPRVAPASLE